MNGRKKIIVIKDLYNSKAFNFIEDLFDIDYWNYTDNGNYQKKPFTLCLENNPKKNRERISRYLKSEYCAGIIQNERSFFCACCMRSSGFNKPLYIYADTIPEGYNSLYYLVQFAMCSKKGDIIFSGCEAACEFFRSFGLSSKALFYSGIDLEVFYPANIKEKKRLRAKAGIPTDAKVILYAGRADEKKGILNLLAAAALAENKIRQLYCVLCLIYPDNTYFKKVKKNAALFLNVLLLKNLPRNRLRDMYCIADLYIVPSAQPETFGRSPHEALACGIPVVLPNNRFFSDLIHNNCAFQVDPVFHKETATCSMDPYQLADKISRALKDEKELYAKRLGGLEYIKKFRKNQTEKQFKRQLLMEVENYLSDFNNLGYEVMKREIPPEIMKLFPHLKPTQMSPKYFRRWRIPFIPERAFNRRERKIRNRYVMQFTARSLH